jgi:choline dehydrogenase-like flavoprotein
MLLCKKDSDSQRCDALCLVGSVVASRLSEIPHWRVLLIEAGVNEPTGTQVPSMFLNFVGSDIDWGYRTEPEEHACLNEAGRMCYWPRGKVPVFYIEPLSIRHSY